jgi:hypothetical protein
MDGLATKVVKRVGDCESENPGIRNPENQVKSADAERGIEYGGGGRTRSEVDGCVRDDAPHITEHFESSFDRAGLTCNATRAASVNASLTPRFLIAEHSAYLLALFTRMIRYEPYRDISTPQSASRPLIPRCTESSASRDHYSPRHHPFRVLPAGRILRRIAQS